MSNILSYLFETNAIKFCKENEPFWYTSGKIGPYFFNAQFVYGGENDSEKFLSFITNNLTLIRENNLKKEELPQLLFKEIIEKYNSNKIYNDVINQMREYIEKNININCFEYISGGERRDWFFSIILANLLNKKHLTLFKDMSTLVSTSDFSKTEYIQNLHKAKVLHLADLITTASSYIKMWIPIINKLNGKMEDTLVLIDRNQNGKEILNNANVTSHSLITVNKEIFKQAYKLGFINQNQLELVTKYFENPDNTMREFLINHPEFIKKSLSSTDERTLKRVNTLINENLYNIQF